MILGLVWLVQLALSVSHFNIILHRLALLLRLLVLKLWITTNPRTARAPFIYPRKLPWKERLVCLPCNYLNGHLKHFKKLRRLCLMVELKYLIREVSD